MRQQKHNARRNWRWVIGMAAFCLGVGAHAAAPALEVGIFPYLSVRALLSVHAPLKAYLETHFVRPVNMSTAPNFRDVYERTRSGDYDLVILPPHLARMAQLDAGYVPVAIYSKVLKGVLAVRRDSPYQKTADLAGKHIVAPDRMAIATFMGVEYLREQGLVAGTSYTLSISTSHASAAYAVTQREFDAVITERAAFEHQIPDDVRAQLRVLTTMGSAPHVMFLAHPRLGKEKIERLRELLIKFASEDPEGRRFVEKGGWEGIRAVTDADLRAMDVYQPELRRLMERAQ